MSILKLPDPQVKISILAVCHHLFFYIFGTWT